MPYVLVGIKVEDYAKWKSVFDEYGPARKSNGSKGAQIFLNADEPNEVVILVEFENLDKPREFFRTKGLRGQMQRAGILGPPDIRFLQEADRTVE